MVHETVSNIYGMILDVIWLLFH